MTLSYSYQNIIVKFFFGLMLLIVLYFIYKAALLPLSFDDAYMFTRYAKNFLVNHNFGWNAGERTYGCTSIGYMLFVTFIESIFPKSFAGDEIVLKFSSFFWGILALVYMYKSLKIVTNNSVLKKVYWPQLITLLILFMPVFINNLFSGMDTTMSLFGDSFMIFLFLQYNRKQSLLFLFLAALSSYFIFFIRPDNGICMIVFPALFLWKKAGKLKPFIIVYSIIFVCMAIDTVTKYLYFGYIIPLPFYIKSFGLYDGYLGIYKWNVTQYLYDIFIYFFALIIIFILFIKKPAIKKAFVYWFPLLLTYGYFYTVVQVMGMASRYYLPFVPFFILGLSVSLTYSFSLNKDPDVLTITEFKNRILLLLSFIAVIRIFGYCSDAYYTRLYTHAAKEAKKYSLYNNLFAANALPEIEWWPSILIFDSLLKKLPVTTVVAASEDGFIASDNISMRIIDLSQLNNNDIFQKKSLLYSIEKNKPDVIWLPHTDYTKMRSELFDSYALLYEYDFYPGILDYGIAVKRIYIGYDTVVSYFKSFYKVKNLKQYPDLIPLRKG